MYKGKAMWGHNETVTICKPEREVSPETKPASILILDIQPPELCENKCLLFKATRLWFCYGSASWLRQMRIQTSGGHQRSKGEDCPWSWGVEVRSSSGQRSGGAERWCTWEAQEGWVFGVDMSTLLYLKRITNKDLLYSTGNAAQYSVTTLLGKEFEKEWIRVYV